MAAELVERIRQAEREAENIERQAGEEAAADRRRILDEAQSRRDEGLRSARAEGEAIRRAAEEEAASACRELTERAIARRDAVIRLAAERLLADDA